MPIELTAAEREILRLLQADAGLTIEEIASRVGLSVSATQRRLQRLRANKVILGEVALVDPKAVGRPLTLLVELELERDRPELMPALQQWIARSADVQQAWTITGRGDCTLVVLAASIEDFDALMERLMVENPNVRKFTTSVVLRSLKRSLAVPID